MTEPVLCGMKYIIKKIIDTERAKRIEIQIGAVLSVNFFKGAKVFARNNNDVLSWLLPKSKIAEDRYSKIFMI
jgi:hypothetical protein